MSYKDWEDDLPDFDYSNPVPTERPQNIESNINALNSPQQVEDAIRREEARAKALQEEYERIRAEGGKRSKQSRQSSKKLQNAVNGLSSKLKADDEMVEIPRAEEPTTREEYERNIAAQQQAYQKYRAGHTDKASGGFGKFTKVLSIPYIATLIAFVASLTAMNVLPFVYWVAMIVILGLLSLIVVIQLRKVNVRKWAKILATIVSVVLIAVYGMGSAYALGTLSFLDKTTVKNEDKVAHITKEPFNVLITGIDVYGKIEKQGRSDVNMLVTVNPETGTILMTSVPRDYQVRLPKFGYATDKLTHSGFYGVDVTIGAMEDLLDTEVNYYVRVNFSTVYLFIDALGGLDVMSDYEFTPVKMPDWTVKKGLNHMTGKQALAFARERKSFMEGDRQRVKNQQLVFEAMLKKATSSKSVLLGYSKVLSKTQKYFQMSMSSAEIRSLVKLQLAKNPSWKMYKNAITGGDAHMGTYTTGRNECYVMSQDITCVSNAQEYIKAVMNGQELQKDDEGNITIVQTTEVEAQD